MSDASGRAEPTGAAGDLFAWEETVTPEQARRALAEVGPMLAWLGRARSKLERDGRGPGDPLLRAASRAFFGVQELHVRLHYLSCTSGVAKPRPTREMRDFGRRGA